ncbi:D-alanyl-lipoteichoic acid biosynthesis protein DltD [Clostridium sp. ATCC 25772]|uniref:D-alanyl-lipoteichoic acid biosynthesis protein DltD n=1 Tax=Clostridium sp. ATCC 25772 TaxID=1676991 RepID=UPI0007853850|nr:D-alanyl-lipoteichoic acid biosynthesis protein DltD [Clostridium sp. ATCC 25772]
MKNAVRTIIGIGLFFVLSIGFLTGSQIYLKSKLESKYNDNVDKALAKDLSVDKFQGIYIQNKELQNNNLMLYGSSELSTTFIPQHPNNFYLDKESNYNISVIGRGHCQSIIHAINTGALNNTSSNKKIAFVLSPQWFTEDGLSKEGFEANFSELQFYKLMNNKNISKELKLKICARIIQFTDESSNLKNIKLYSKLYSNNNIISNIGLGLLKPYYYIKEEALYTLDLKQSLDKINEVKDEESKVNKKPIDWTSQLEQAVKEGEKAATNNEYGVYDSYFEKYIKNDYEKLKGSYKTLKYTESPEYNDLDLLIEICKETGVKPLLISVPVHSKWYDYCGFDKNNKEEYYEKIREIALKNNIELLDLSEKENEKYVLCDIMHLGWKGWVYINEEIDQYYNEN